MAESETMIDASPECVFEVLLDVGTYPDWVVGCQRIRACDPSWPAPGARFHHRVGVGPLAVDDSTAIVSLEPPRRLVLEARAGPVGTAEVVFEVSPEGEGSRVTITEQPVGGPAAVLRNIVQDGLLQFRNVETLRRLRECVEKRKAGRSEPESSHG
ncbi:MAG: polyketide cyclase [Actinobacteria bacterium]|nr:MAG: polyketide cyclase [Actinomycetota bacterium]